MNLHKKQNYYSLAFVLAGLLPLIYAATQYLNADLWWDEILSLVQSSLAGFGSTVTNYQDANNHVFFNILTGLALKVRGVRDIDGALDHARYMRSMQLAFSVLTVVYVYYFAKRFIGEGAASLSVVLLSTTIPFLNFAMQLRGYSLSMLLAAALLFHLWSYLVQSSKFHAIMISITAFLLLYTIPSNIYFVTSLIAAIGIEYAVRRIFKNPAAGFSGKKVLFGLIFIAIGCMIAALAYFPLLKQILDCRFVSKAAVTRFYVPCTIFPSVSFMFLSSRYLLPAMMAIGVGVGIVRLFTTWTSSGPMTSFIRLSLLYMGPFIVSFARNDMPFDRSFVMLAPVFSLLLASGTSLFIATLSSNPKISRIAAMAAALYCLATCGWSLHTIQQVLKNDIAIGTRHQDLLRNSYQSCLWKPIVDLEMLATACRKNPCPIMVFGDVDKVAVNYYLERLKLTDYYYIMLKHDNFGNPLYIESHPDPLSGRIFEQFDLGRSFHMKDDDDGLFVRLFMQMLMSHTLALHGSCYVITASPQRFTILLRSLSAGFDPVRINADDSYTTIFRITVPTSIYLP